MNSSSLSKLQIAAVVQAALSLGFAAAAVSGAPIMSDIALAALAMGASGCVLHYASRTSHFLGRISTCLNNIDKGELDTRLTCLEEAGELRTLALGLNAALDRIEAYVRESAASLFYVSRNKYFRLIEERGMLGAFAMASRGTNQAVAAIAHKVGDFGRVAEGFQSVVGDIGKSFGDVSQRLESCASQLQQSASLSADRSVTVSAAAEQTAGNVHTVAAAAEEMSASINEISRQTSTAAVLTAQASNEAVRAGSVISSLAETSASIGVRVQLITDIAESTNLLALNATIEAARAGEAGKGFAVVASEVKSLAAQTARATEEISAKITQMQHAAVDSVKVIERVAKAVSDLRQSASTVAAAVEEQSATMQDVSRNIAEVASGTATVQRDIVMVSEAASQTKSDATDVADVSHDIRKRTENLDAAMSTFMTSIRKAI